MPDLLATFQINAPLPGLVPAVPLRAAPVVVPEGGATAFDFGAALTGLLIPGAAPKGKGERQSPAASGKELPVEDEATPDSLIAWMPSDAAPMPLVSVAAQPEGDAATLTEPGIATAALPQEAAPAPASAADPDSKAGRHPAVPGPAPQSEPGKIDLTPQARSAAVHAVISLPPAAQLNVGVASKLDGVETPDVNAPRVNPAATIIAAAHLVPAQGPAAVAAAAHAGRAATPEAPASSSADPAQPAAVGASDDASSALETAPSAEPEVEVELAQPRARFDASHARDASQPAPAFVALRPAPPAPASAGIAAQVFATAITTAATDPAPVEPSGEPLVAPGITLVEQRNTVPAMSGTSQQSLDMSRDDWTGQMIERIAALRDSAEAADTRIKLAPENLGALEVSIRRDGDRIHVHFTADNPAARQLIADAAPRLAELADARGVKLGQTSVDGGGQHGSQREARQQAQHAPARNASAAARSEPDTDDRIA